MKVSFLNWFSVPRSPDTALENESDRKSQRKEWHETCLALTVPSVLVPETPDSQIGGEGWQVVKGHTIAWSWRGCWTLALLLE